jgi:hypothetical protein
MPGSFLRQTKRGQENPSDAGANLDKQATGLYILDVPDEDAALLWAERHPAARIGAIKVRPVSPPPPRK